MRSDLKISLSLGSGFLFALFLVFGVFSGTGFAQMQVSLELPRTLYIRYEPIIAIVNVTNLSGRPMLLQDTETTPWFGFQIEGEGGRPVPARTSTFSGNSVAINPGETLRRRVNLTPIFQLDDFGRYTMRASVFDAETGRYFRSSPANLEITDGRLIWQQTVGHPLEQSERQITLLAHRLTNSTGLYVRVQDPAAGRVYCTHRLGPLVAHGRPQVEIDANNEVHIFHMQAPKNYVHSHIGLNGEVLGRQAYEQAQTRPELRREPDGQVLVVGGALHQPKDETEAGPPDSISDRPVPLPAPNMQPAMPVEEEKSGGFKWPFQR